MRNEGSTARWSWVFADQALSSLTNFAVGLAAARTLTARQFGVFSVVLLSYVLIQGTSKTISFDALLVRHQSIGRLPSRDLERQASGVALVIGLIGAGACLIGAALFPFSRQFLVIISILLPGLLVQDGWRYIFVARGEGRQAFFNDLVWAIGVIPGLALAMSGSDSKMFILAWAVPGFLAGIVGCFQARVIPRPNMAWTWILRQYDLIGSFMVEFVAFALSSNLTIMSFGLMLGLEALGQVRATQLVFGPLQVLFIGAGIVSIPEYRHILDSGRDLNRHAWMQGSFLAGAALLVLVAVRIIPVSLGELLLREKWRAVHELSVPFGLMIAANGFSQGPISGLRALERVRETVLIRLGNSVAAVLFGILGMTLLGVLGGLWALGLIAGMTAIVWSLAFRGAGHNRLPE